MVDNRSGYAEQYREVVHEDRVRVARGRPHGLEAEQILVEHRQYRGRVADRWRTQRWDALRLLTPNWLSPAASPSRQRARSLHGSSKGGG